MKNEVVADIHPLLPKMAWGLFLIPCIVLQYICFTRFGQPEIFIPQGSGKILFVAFSILSVGLIVAAKFLPGFMLKSLAKMASQGQDRSNTRSMRLMANVGRWALLDTVSAFGAAVSVFVGANIHLPFALVAIVGLILAFPRES